MLAPMRPRPISPSCTLDLLRISGGCFEPAITSDQRIGRAVVLEPRFCRAFELWNDPLGQNLAQLHTPLIKGIDLPDGALGEDAVFIERDQGAESDGRKAVQQEGVGGTI